MSACRVSRSVRRSRWSIAPILPGGRHKSNALISSDTGCLPLATAICYDSTPMSDERDERLKKLESLRGLKIDPFGRRFDGGQPAAQVVARFAELENKPATVAGRVTRLHMMGKTGGKFDFVDVRDWTGKIQVQAKQDKLGPEGWAVFENVHIGDLVAFT